MRRPGGVSLKERKMFATFLSSEAGSVTVDWTLLTAVLSGLSVAMIGLLSVAAQTPTNAVNSTLNADVIGQHSSFD